MLFLFRQGRRGAGGRQPGYWALALAALAAGCAQGGPLQTPIDWWHSLQGGTIAANRPPPPGADLRYPDLGPMPVKPKPPDKAARAALLDQLATERDRTQRIAARNPIMVIPTSTPLPPKPAAPDEQTANASLPAAESVAPPAAPATNTAALLASPEMPIPTGPVVVAGAGLDQLNLPPIPESPPAPATFEGVASEPLPTPLPPMPPRLPPASRGAQVLFPTGQATLEPSQLPTLKDVAFRRKGRIVEIVGYGEAAADTPEAQEAAIDLGFKRAEIIALALTEKQHIPQSALRLNADAFGRGASVRVLP